MEDRDRAVVESHLSLDERVRRRAHELWRRRTDEERPGSEVDDWLEAEREIVGDSPRQPAQDRATVVGPAGVRS